MPNFGYGRQIMHTDVKKQGLPQMSGNRPSIWFTGIGNRQLAPSTKRLLTGYETPWPVTATLATWNEGTQRLKPPSDPSVARAMSTAIRASRGRFTNRCERLRKYCAGYIKRLNTRHEACWNVTQCYICHAKRGYATLETSKSDPLWTRHRHGYTGLARTVCERHLLLCQPPARSIGPWLGHRLPAHRLPAHRPTGRSLYTKEFLYINRRV